MGTTECESSGDREPTFRQWLTADAVDSDRVVDRNVFLIAVSDVLADALDLADLLERVVRLAVPELADTASIELLREGQLEVAAIADADSAAELILRQHATGRRIDYHGDYPLWRVLDSLTPLLVADVPEEVYSRFVTEPERLEFVLKHRAGTGMCVPMKARNEILGTMSFARLVGRPAYNTEDLSLAVDLARRTEVAIDNARP